MIVAVVGGWLWRWLGVGEDAFSGNNGVGGADVCLLRALSYFGQNRNRS